MRLDRSLSLAVVSAVMAVFLITPAPSRAQGSSSGSLTGTVADSSGAVLPGVTVVAKGRRPD